MKSLLLGSAAGLAAVAGAQAADLPVRKAAPVEYVRVCSAYGVGFFYIPGTETCLRVSGFARFEYNIASNRLFQQDLTGFRSIGRLNLDARTQTAYGTLRSFVRFDMARRTGQFFSGTAQRRGEAETPTGFDFVNRGQTQITLDKAFIQFAGITAGRATSFFDFYSNDLTWFGIVGSDRGATNLLAYTASFGSGWSATISMEDPQERRYPLAGIDAAGVVAFPANVGAGLLPAPNGAVVFVPGQGFFNVGLSQRNAMPDVVLAARVDQAWGSAQLSGAVHQISPIGGTNAIAGVGVVNTNGFRADTEYGYALQAGLKVNLPMIAPGDLLYLQAAYARGALDYTISGAWTFGGATGVQGGFFNIIGGTNGRFGYTTADGIIDQFGDLRLTRSFSALAAFLHYWTPQLRSGFAVAYAKVDFPSQNSLFLGGVVPGALATVGTFRDWSIISGVANLIWSPVRDLDIGVEVTYDKVRLSGAPVADLNRCGNVIAGCTFFTKSEDEWRGRLRIHRNF